MGSLPRKLSLLPQPIYINFMRHRISTDFIHLRQTLFILIKVAEHETFVR